MIPETFSTNESSRDRQFPGPPLVQVSRPAYQLGALERLGGEQISQTCTRLCRVNNGSLTMMYEAVRGALAADNALKQQDQETFFRVRETPEWKKHAAALEAEMLKRGMLFEVIDWSEDRAKPPFEEPCRHRVATENGALRAADI